MHDIGGQSGLASITTFLQVPTRSIAKMGLFALMCILCTIFYIKCEPTHTSVEAFVCSFVLSG